MSQLCLFYALVGVVQRQSTCRECSLSVEAVSKTCDTTLVCAAVGPSASCGGEPSYYWREAESLKTVKSLHCSHFLYFLCSVFNIWRLFRPSASSDLQLQFAQEHVCVFESTTLLQNHKLHFLCNLQEYVSLSSTLTLLTLTLLVMVDCSVSMLNANIEKTIKQHLDLFSFNIMSL